MATIPRFRFFSSYIRTFETFLTYKFQIYADSRASLVAQRLKHLPAMQGTWVRSLGSGRSPGEGNGNPLQYSCLENPMDGGAWWATVHRVVKSRTRLSDFTFTFTYCCVSVSQRTHCFFVIFLFFCLF